ncbi:MAG: membrane dipeptidase [Polyangiaceae bacterium]
MFSRRSLLAWAGAAAVSPASAEAAVPVVDLAVHLPTQVLRHHRGIALGSGQADAVRLRRGGAYGVVLVLERPPEAAVSLEAGYLHVFRALARAPYLRIPGCRRPGPGIRTWLKLNSAAELSSTKEIPLWVTRGVRMFGLSTRDGRLAGAAPAGLGLSPRGADMVRAIHDAGAVVDVSGSSQRAIDDVLGLASRAKAPVVATHTAAGALAEHAWNLSDTHLSAIGQSGGIVGIAFDPRMLHRGKRADLGDVVRHVRHAVGAAGVDHVGIGSGFEGGLRPPHELLNASRYPRLVGALQRQGMPLDAVRRVLGRNALRVLCY